ncbi:MAG TPA: GtrA family protein [Gaiellales bacterium]
MTVLALPAAALPAPARRSWSRHAPFARYCAVGASGYVVNSALFWLLDRAAPYPIAFALAFVAAASTNFALNRAWTFRGGGGRVSPQYVRFLAVSLVALAADLLVLTALVEGAGVPKMVAAAVAIAAATPASFAGNRLWTFRAAAATRSSCA